ncbi:2-octaprenyl-6-methoxyphenyl hydroxylase [Roseobacter sp. HKCCD9010]|uniref:FAD-dependent monooxygenase n=1 Tax=unclassified Roseobacter TaxID=196798 RepID=UPI001491090F|nr:MULTISPECIES: FAD-dependent monooxygenase [unclassified Roseobacter]MBF9048588.1 2-octaprenyl-6-methoxyphenyl hydroxylase [Rhodobacterales bacterium HKCCD4356]NNV10587.1 2-octaprenyl-6-methoxyphenyl hydroxylase [Roseobacter sp. HKCCD7357]NNV14772.1 2-octaprenyl-6-methoxyphenyl hydroxylase [Roseobacter sp. HKCCD8768]NNV24231.1 2-octaprenyl-6-methoxyphenyl hydroxylase [Roseobacter sp. HKCCD8192]NNV28488.1 2-octaprenyl-6-methoxyphenyl hydroxylase [Roseobacter sp. HKCCD9061]
MAHDADVLIVGGGLNGPCLALALAQAGFSSLVLDAQSTENRGADTFDGRSYALALASTKLLDALGLWEDLADHAQPILEVIASDGRAGEGPSPFFLHFDHAEIEEGPMGHMLEDRYLRQALLAAMEADPLVTHRPGARVIAQDTETGARVTLDDGTDLTARLLIGADGRQSGVAARAGIKRTGWDYGQTALVCAIAHEKPHNGIAHQFFMPPGPLAILPLPGNRSSIVWSETHEAAARINALSDADYLDALRPRFGDFLGEISLEGARFSYPLTLTLASSFVAPNLALVGDAAHGVHPIAGQGLNLGLRDVGALAEVLADAKRRGEDFGAIDVLERYQTWRRFDTAALAAGMDAVNKLFSNDNPLLRAGRDLGLGVVNALPGLRRRFIREAAGLAGDLPRLLRGRPL